MLNYITHSNPIKFLTCPCHEICRVEAVVLSNKNKTKPKKKKKKKKKNNNNKQTNKIQNKNKTKTKNKTKQNKKQTKTDFCEYVKFWKTSSKFDILLITA